MLPQQRDKGNTSIWPEGGVMDALTYLAGQGATFALPYGRSKHRLPDNWQNTPHTLAEARAHAGRGGNVGILCGAHSGGIVVLDLDKRFEEFLGEQPDAARTLRVRREKAPGRGKLIYRVTDQLPRSRAAREPGDKKPYAEILSTGKHALIPPSEYDGCRYILEGQEYGILEITHAQLASLWLWWTGRELEDSRPVTLSRPAPSSHTHGTRLVDLIKSRLTPREVFAQFGVIGAGDKERRERFGTRIFDHGGLFTDVGGDPQRWYCFADETGGDAIDAAGYALYGPEKWNSRDPEQFKAVLLKLSVAAALDEAEYAHLLPEPGRPATSAIDRQLDQAEQTAGALDWRELAGRSRATDRKAFLAVLGIMRAAGTATVAVSCRTLAERAGMGAETAARALARLCDYGLLALAARSNGFDANLYSLGAAALDTSRSGTLQDQGSGVKCPTSQHIDLALLRELAAHDAFLWGARDGDDPASGSIGATALEVIAALQAGACSIGEIAEATGAHRSTVSQKVKTLAKLGLVWLQKVGRNLIVHLYSEWRATLEALKNRLTTCGRTARRIFDHLQQRLARLRALAGYVRTRGLRERMADFEEKWRKRLETSQRQIWLAKAAQGVSE